MQSDSKMMVMELVLMFLKPVLMVTRMMELEPVFLPLLVVDPISLMMEMETVSLLLKNTSLFSFCMIHQENPPDVTQPAPNVSLVDNVLFVKLVMLLIQPQNNVFIAMDVFHAMDQTQPNVQDVSILNFLTELP